MITLTLRGLEERPFLDAFERLVGAEGVSDARATVSSRSPARTKPGSKFLVDMGFPLDKVDTEVPSYDWVYSNVHVEAYLK